MSWLSQKAGMEYLLSDCSLGSFRIADCTGQGLMSWMALCGKFLKVLIEGEGEGEGEGEEKGEEGEEGEELGKVQQKPALFQYIAYFNSRYHNNDLSSASSQSTRKSSVTLKTKQ